MVKVGSRPLQARKPEESGSGTEAVVCYTEALNYRYFSVYSCAHNKIT